MKILLPLPAGEGWGEGYFQMKNILLAVCGLSPQVITEALYALHQEGRCVDEIYVITTRQGKDIINAQLLSPVDGQYYQYLRDYRIEAGQIAFGPDHIQVIVDERGKELPDIIETEDNERFLKKCLELTFDLTREAETAVFFLVAGGRKTMSSCLTLAAQLYGRPQDRIYHVLVSPEFENNRDFFYPPPKSAEIELRDKKGEPFRKQTIYAKISLIPLPFVSLRDRLGDECLTTAHDPATLLLSVVRDEKPSLTIILAEKKIIYKGLELDLPPALFTFYAFLVRRKINCPNPANTCQSCHDCFLTAGEIMDEQDQLIALYRRITANTPWLFERSETLKQSAGNHDEGGHLANLNAKAINEYKSKIKNKLIQGYGQQASSIFITSVGKKPDTRYGIDLDKGRIRYIVKHNILDEP